MSGKNILELNARHSGCTATNVSSQIEPIAFTERTAISGGTVVMIMVVP